jgi:ppGpp synthetase/RelA/SpoT-type nucleotidyltranferase
MQSALLGNSVPLGSTPPQSTRTRRTTSTIVGFRSTTPDPVATPWGGEAASSCREASYSGASASFKSSTTGSTTGGLLLSKDKSIPKSLTYVKVEGFPDTQGSNSGARSEEEITVTTRTTILEHQQQTKMTKASSLLTRQLSAEDLARDNTLVFKRETCGGKASPPPPPCKGQEIKFSFDNSHPPSQQAAWRSLADLQSSYPVFSEPLAAKAFNIARVAHKNADAFAKCVGAASILAELGADEVTVAGALLHDSLDATMLTESHLRSATQNEDVVELVLRVSHIEYVCQKYRLATKTTKKVHNGSVKVMNERQGLELVDLLVAHSGGSFDPKPLLISLAVALEELRRHQTSSSSAAAAAAEPAASLDAHLHFYSKEAIEVWAPLANRLGIWTIKAELEDRAFRVLHPAEYSSLKHHLEKVQDPTRLVALVDELRIRLQDAGVEYLDLSGRPKHLWGVWKKMQKKKYSTVENVQDVRGARIIVKSREDCYRALRAVETLGWVVVGSPKNYIKCPKPNGYQSLHVVVDPGDGHLVEIQIRTDKMHYLAEYGARASHWRYKEQEKALPSTPLDSIHAPDSAREANWAKFAAAKHMLCDKKFRPSGSPTEDKSLDGLQSLIISGPTVAKGGSLQGNATDGISKSTFPTSNKSYLCSAGESRSFYEYIAASGQRPDSYLSEERRAVVAVVAGGKFSISTLQAGSTLGQLLEAQSELKNHKSQSINVVINRQVENDFSLLLRPGDVVELYPAVNTAAVGYGNMIKFPISGKKIQASSLS